MTQMLYILDKYCIWNCWLCEITDSGVNE